MHPLKALQETHTSCTTCTPAIISQLAQLVGDHTHRSGGGIRSSWSPAGPTGFQGISRQYRIDHYGNHLGLRQELAYLTRPAGSTRTKDFSKTE